MSSTYTLTEGNDALNRVLLMMRYELGKTLGEQKSDFAMDRQANAIARSTGIRNQKDYETTEKIIKKASPLPSKTMTLDEFMEEFRETLTNPFMVGLEVFLTSTGVGVTAVVAAYTALLAYDVYKGVTKNEWGWLDIIFDILGIVSSGVLSETIAPIMKGAKNLKLNTLGKVLKYLSETKIWSKIKPAIESGITLLKSISKNIWKALSWISEKTGFRQLKVAGKSVEVTVHNIIYNIEEFLKSSFKKTVKFLEPGAKVGAKSALKRGLIAAGFTHFFKEKIVPYLKGLSNEKTIFKRGVDKSQDEVLDIISEKNRNLFKNNINQIIFVTNSDHTLNTVIINNNEYELTNTYKLIKQ